MAGFISLKAGNHCAEFFDARLALFAFLFNTLFCGKCVLAPFGEHMAISDACLRLRNEPHEPVLLRVHCGIQRLELLLQCDAGGQKRGFSTFRKFFFLVHLPHGLLNLDQPLMRAVILVEKEVDLQVFDFVPQAQISPRGRALLLQRSKPVGKFL
ncbi:hypothetical protein SDC9_190393 [bioreactor metagenome]|uniref:Uncharacterized protein n=1 Tax=bioreactor metagenome TaxID=1076179 RepID=A0A645HUV5_9ZZZZ